MPVYDFKCQECGKVTEFLLSGHADSRKPTCPDCGSQNLERLISAPSLLRNAPGSGATCCGRTERCETPPCSTNKHCRRH
jgi:putative FmdB family regulatory protein